MIVIKYTNHYGHENLFVTNFFIKIAWSFDGL